MRRRLRHVIVLVALILLQGAFQEVPPSRALGSRIRNIVLILTDDQRFDTMWAMPKAQALLADEGVTFTNAFVVNPLCCPSRASILTGKYSHGTGVYTNGGQYGGFGNFDDSSTIATWLHDEGYTTALVGKYLNHYEGTPYIPPGWDQWVAFSDNTGEYYDYDLNVNGVIEHRGSTRADYSTTLLADYAEDFILTAPERKPFFLYFSLFAPHGHATPERQYRNQFSNLRGLKKSPAFNERNVRDKPKYIRDLSSLDDGEIERLDSERKGTYETLLSVDDAVESVVTALETTGQLDNTLIVFTSDNGNLFGEHRWNYKIVPYEESIRVPLVVRYDPLLNGPIVDDHLALNIDLAPTFAGLAGVDAPGADGSDLLLPATGQAQGWRTDFLIESLHYRRHRKGNVPTYCAVRNERYIYVDYQGSAAEFYNLNKDPYELENSVNREGAAAPLATMQARLAELCNPPPPGNTLGD